MFVTLHGSFPHVALAVFNDIDILEMERLIEKVTENESMFTIKMLLLKIMSHLMLKLRVSNWLNLILLS